MPDDNRRQVVLQFEHHSWARDFIADVNKDIELSRDKFSELYGPLVAYWRPDLPPPEKISTYCKKQFTKLCHICEDADCSDNMTPSIRALKSKLYQSGKA